MGEDGTTETGVQRSIALGSAVAAGAGRFRRLLPLVALFAMGCTERALLEVDAESAPGQKTPTEEVEIPIGGLISWRDTTYIGYSVPATSSYRVIADSTQVQSRVLGRVQTIPDSVDTSSGRQAIEQYVDGKFRLVLDTLVSHVPPSGMDLEIYALSETYDQVQTTWTLREEEIPWSTPGGDLGELIASTTIDAPFDSVTSDTVFVPFVASTDSILSAWRVTDGEPGYVIRVSGSTAFVQISSVALLFDAKPEQQDTLIRVARSPAGSTVIFDPETPDPGTTSRLAGLPSARIYLEFEIPDTWQGLQLKGSTINAAALVFRPANPAPIPFLLEYPLEVTTFSLLADPFVYGAKTPIGATLGAPVLLDPEAITEDDAKLVVGITPAVLAWSLALSDTINVLRIGLQALPEGRGLGY
ncbi:MAG: hypothetical protein ACWGON_02045, partial [Gemmatimonadota bacterium]